MIIIDTHILLWWINDQNKLSEKAIKIINQQIDRDVILVSSISIWEICLLIKKDRISLNLDLDRWIEKIENLPFLRFIPVDNQIAQKSVNLPGTFHSDPADRIIVATAREKGTALITSDKKIRKYRNVQAIW